MPTRVFGIEVPHLTEPDGFLLAPDVAKQGAREFIDLVCPLLREIVNFSSHALRWAEEGMAALPTDVALASLRLHYQVLEMIDGVEILLREACPYPAMGPLRSAIEGDLYLTALHAYEDFNAASLTWLVGQVRRHISDYRKKTPGFGVAKKKIVVCGEKDEALYTELEKSIAGLQGYLASPHLKAIAEQATTPWYRALYGATNLRELGAVLDARMADEEEPDSRNGYREKAYLFLYSRYANALHGSDYGRILGPGSSDSEEPFIASLRNTDAMAEVVRIAAGTLLNATRLQVRRFRADREKELVDWYVTKVRDRYMRLNAMNISVNWISKAWPRTSPPRALTIGGARRWVERGRASASGALRAT